MKQAHREQINTNSTSYTDVRILIVDDDPDIIDFLTYNLKKEGFRVASASDGLEGIAKASEYMPHLILLDVMMPQIDGIETCHRLRNMPQFDNVLIVFLSARHEEYSEIAGLEAGADDYIQKPIRPRLLVSRIKAILRRHGNKQGETSIVQLGNLTIDREKIEVHIDQQRIELAKKEFEILLLLSSRPGKVFGRKEIYRKVWGTNVIVGNRTIDVHISKLREKIGNKYIKTVKGIGYKLDF